MSPSTNTKLVPNDPRISHRTAFLNGHTYAYLHSEPAPSTPHRGHIILIHGFPDLSFGWRNQIPFLTSLGLTVIAPDCLGYGRSDSPPTSSLSAYGYRTIATDMATLCAQLSITSVILGGHDWGGAIVYRIAQYHPQLVKAIFSICTPYFAPNPKYEPLDILVAKRLPNFRYQCHFVSGEVEEHIQSKSEIRQFLNAMYGATTPSRDVGFIAEQGVLFENLPKLRSNPLLSEREMDYYVSEYARHGINGPLNWYRTREVNYMDELAQFFDNDPSSKKQPVIEQEVLFVLATKDQALKPFMAEKMGEKIPRLTRREIVAGHWALWQKPEEVNEMVGKWLEEKVFKSGKSKL